MMLIMFTMSKTSNYAVWADHAARRINDYLESIASANNEISIFLTAGQSAAVINPLLKFPINTKINIFLTDDRIGAVGDDNNSNSIRNSISLCDNVDIEFYSYPLTVFDSADVIAASYANSLPARIDVVIVSIADDGHFASIFDLNKTNSDRCLIGVYQSPLHHYRRLSVTPLLIDKAKKVFVLAPTPHKKNYRILAKKGMLPKNSPANILVNEEWL